MGDVTMKPAIHGAFNLWRDDVNIPDIPSFAKIEVHHIGSDEARTARYQYLHIVNDSKTRLTI